jgi:hypothetical protein
MGRTTRHFRALLLVAVLLASIVTRQSHQVGTPQHPGRAAHIHAPQHAPPRPAGRYVALPLGRIEPREAWLARPSRGDAVPPTVTSLRAYARTRGPPLTDLVAA